MANNAKTVLSYQATLKTPLNNNPLTNTISSKINLFLCYDVIK